MTTSSYYRYITINSSGTGTKNIINYLTGGGRFLLSDTDLQAGGGFRLIVHSNQPYPDKKPFVRVQLFDSAGSELKNYDVQLTSGGTFLSGVYAIPDTAVNFRIALLIPSSAVYDNVIIYPIIIKLEWYRQNPTVFRWRPQAVRS